MLETIELVIFDMDGLMFDTERLAYEGAIAACENIGLKIDIEALKYAIGQFGFDKRKLIIGEIPPDIDFDAYLYEFMENRRAELIKQGVPKKPGLDELIAILKENNIKIAIGTSTPLSRTMIYLENAGMTETFDCIVTGDQVAQGKPAPDIFLTVCQRLDVSPDKAIVLEDSANGAIASQAAGIRCIIVPDIVAPSQQIRDIAYRVVDSLYEVQKMLFPQQ